MSTRTILTALLGGASVLALAPAALAQSAAAPAPAANEVVVTGSRVIANGNNSPTPVTVVSSNELAQLAPTTINDALNTLPVFQGSTALISFNLPRTSLASLAWAAPPCSRFLLPRDLRPHICARISTAGWGDRRAAGGRKPIRLLAHAASLPGWPGGGGRVQGTLALLRVE